MCLSNGWLTCNRLYPEAVSGLEFQAVKRRLTFPNWAVPRSMKFNDCSMTCSSISDSSSRCSTQSSFDSWYFCRKCSNARALYIALLEGTCVGTWSTWIYEGRCWRNSSPLLLSTRTWNVMEGWLRWLRTSQQRAELIAAYWYGEVNEISSI